MTERVGVLFVCMGNICRSPTAEGVFRRHVNEAGLSQVIAIASAGVDSVRVRSRWDVKRPPLKPVPAQAPAGEKK